MTVLSVVLPIPSVALTSIRHSSGSFRRSDLSFHRSSLSIRRFDFYLSLGLLSVTFAPLSSTLTIYHLFLSGNAMVLVLFIRKKVPQMNFETPLIINLLHNKLLGRFR
ncbi:hypothetical protein ABH966_003247 [Lysinibacillus sp. RC46]|uniref:hypothetical protein n=1 Tax=Lysinibacillus sp. RC46 TaxID=3156295 RepID=UPI003515C3D9